MLSIYYTLNMLLFDYTLNITIDVDMQAIEAIITETGITLYIHIPI